MLERQSPIREDFRQGYVLLCQLAVALNIVPFTTTNQGHLKEGEPTYNAHLARTTWWLIAGVALCLCWGLTGCQSTATLGSNAQQPYQWEGLSHHPAYAWHRDQSDSATLYVRLPAHEPLHLREHRDQPFRFSLQLDLYLQPLDGATADSAGSSQIIPLRYQWTGDADPERKDITASFRLPLTTGRYRVTQSLSDLHRGAKVSTATLLDARSTDAAMRALAFDPATGTPAWDQTLVAGKAAALLIPPDLADALWSYTALPPVDSFPSAPFLDRTPKETRFPPAMIERRPTPATAADITLPPGDFAGWGLLMWDAEPGIHRWTLSGGERHIVLPARRPHFPAMRDVQEMIRATRYIATRDEYRTMREARDPKRALDAFWLQFATKPEDARSLIREYYSRVLEANVHFAGLREGWCTDRGMVYIIFGHPDRSRMDRYGETWIYGEEGDINALIFRFTRRNAADDYNVFDLERYPGFRSPWEAMVSSWRRGKIRKR